MKQFYHKDKLLAMNTKKFRKFNLLKATSKNEFCEFFINFIKISYRYNIIFQYVEREKS